MMKKIMNLVAVGALVVTMVGCTETKEVNVTTTQPIQVQEQQQPKLNKVLVDNEICTITVLEKYQDNTMCEVGYKLHIVNHTDREILIGEDCNLSVNGVMNGYGMFATNVTGGHEGYANWYFVTTVEEQNVHTIEDLQDVEFTLMIWDNNTFDTLYQADVTIE